MSGNSGDLGGPRPLRYITTRELCRRSAALLDDIAENGTTVMVTRNGRPAAVIGPLRDLGMTEEVSWRLVASRDDGSIATAERLPEFELNEMEQQTLITIASRPPKNVWIPSTHDPALVQPLFGALLRLMEEGLVSEDFAGYRCTPLGRKVAAALKSRREGECDAETAGG